MFCENVCPPLTNFVANARNFYSDCKKDSVATSGGRIITTVADMTLACVTGFCGVSLMLVTGINAVVTALQCYDKNTTFPPFSDVLYLTVLGVPAVLTYGYAFDQVCDLGKHLFGQPIKTEVYHVQDDDLLAIANNTGTTCTCNAKRKEEVSQVAVAAKTAIIAKRKVSSRSRIPRNIAKRTSN